MNNSSNPSTDDINAAIDVALSEDKITFPGRFFPEIIGTTLEVYNDRNGEAVEAPIEELERNW